MAKLSLLLSPQPEKTDYTVLVFILTTRPKECRGDREKQMKLAQRMALDLSFRTQIEEWDKNDKPKN